MILTLIFLIPYILLGQKLPNYDTNPNRLSTLNTHCQSSNRVTLDPFYSVDTPYPFFLSYMNNTFKTDLYNLLLLSQLFDNIRNDSWLTILNKSWNKNSDNIILFIMPHIIGLVLLLLCVPIVACAVRSIRMRNQTSRLFGSLSCVKSNVTIGCVIVLCILGVAGCIAGMAGGYRISYGYNRVSCAAMIAIDDMLNGNISSVKTIDTNNRNPASNIFLNAGGIPTPPKYNFWIGYTAYLNLLSVFNTSYDTITTTLNKLLPFFYPVSQNFNIAMKKLRQIPSLTEASLNIVYNTPLNVKPSETKYKNSSLFNDELGNVSAPNSLIGRAFPVFNFLNSYLDTTLHAIQLFASQNNIKSYTNQVQTTLYNLTSTSQNIANDLDKYLNDNLQPYIFVTSFIEYLSYAIWLLVFLLCLGSTAMFVRSQTNTARKIVTISSIFLFCFSLIGFTLGVLLSLAGQVCYQGCRYLYNSLTNYTTFLNMIHQLNYSQGYFSSHCLLSSTGDIITPYSNNNFTANLLTLQYAMSNIILYNESLIINIINNSYFPITSRINLTANSNSFDLVHDIDLNDSSFRIVYSLANSVNFTKCSKAFPKFTLDSWMPSYYMVNNIIKCRLYPWIDLNNSTCKIIGNCPSGCLDILSIFYEYTDSNKITRFLRNRYGNTPYCENYIIQFTNVWDNYFKIKRDAMIPVAARYDYTSKLLLSIVYYMQTKLTPIIKYVVANISINADAIANPKFGLAAGGTSCYVVGSDMLLLKNVVCHQTFSYAFYHRIICTVLGYIGLVGVCFLQCVNVRGVEEEYYIYDGIKEGIYYNNYMRKESEKKYKVNAKREIGRKNNYKKYENIHREYKQKYVLPRRYKILKKYQYIFIYYRVRVGQDGEVIRSSRSNPSRSNPSRSNPSRSNPSSAELGTQWSLGNGLLVASKRQNHPNKHR